MIRIRAARRRGSRDEIQRSRIAHDGERHSPTTSHRTRQALADLLNSLCDVESTERGSTLRRLSRDWQVAAEIPSGPHEYLVLRRPLASSSSLTPRERKAVQLAMGRATNKEIAWALSVSASTVGVFLWRAARKLGVTGRDSLFRAYAERYPDDGPCTLPGPPDDMTCTSDM